MGNCEEGRVDKCPSYKCQNYSNLQLCVLPRELRWFQEWFMSLMSWGDNDKRLEHQSGGYMHIISPLDALRMVSSAQC